MSPKLRPALLRALVVPLAAGAILASGILTAPAAHATDCASVCPADARYGKIDFVRQLPGRDGFRVAGWAVDPADPTVPMNTVLLDISVNGQKTTSAITAVNWKRDDVNAAHPDWGPNQGFDATMRGYGANDQIKVCATASRGNYQRDLGCSNMDPVVKFVGTSVDYDLSKAALTDPSLTGVFKKKFTNNTNRDQTFAIKASKDVTTSHAWSTTTQMSVGLSVEVGAKVGIPEIADVDVKTTFTVNGSWTWQTTNTESTTDHYEWLDTVVAEKKAITKYTATVTKATLAVPYQLRGYLLYQSGAQETAVGAAGVYTGVTTYDLQTTVNVYDLAGQPKQAQQADQPSAPQFVARTTR